MMCTLTCGSKFLNSQYNFEKLLNVNDFSDPILQKDFWKISISIYTYHRDDTWELTSDGYVNNFDDYRSNQDSDVDTADGKFTASVEGVYQFNFQVQ